MMKSLIIILQLVLITNVAFLQGTFKEKSIIDIFEPGNVMITFFASYPNFESYVLSRGLSPENNNLENFRINGLAPIGLRADLFLSNQFSGTLEAMINNWSLRYTDNAVNVNASMTQFRMLLGFNYHILDHNVENLNLYSGFAFGTNSRTFNRSSSVENYNYPNLLDISNFIGFPLSLRYRVGARYFFNEQWAVNTEAGIGGPIISLGISYRR
ncbi:MAG: hypothetical protein JJT77_10700 [Crocinitomicaceae bacterium]|nr:hypothetical protein [Crocinitomicaceae bacterium]